MTDKERGAGPDGSDVAAWWRTEIIDMAPGRIRLRGRDIQDLIGAVSFAQMIWLMLRGDLPTPAQAALFEAALVAAVDHGPQAPSIAAARMAVTCGLGLNGALASAVNMLDDTHGGAGEQALALYAQVAAAAETLPLEAAIAQEIPRWQSAHGPYLPGFGHRFHTPTDPRAPRLMALVAEAAAAGTVSGQYRAIGQGIEAALGAQKGRPVPMNIDGATAVIYGALGFAPPLARGLFCLSRSVGILAHGWEQMGQGGRNKGPTPPAYRWRYDGPNPLAEGEEGP